MSDAAREYGEALYLLAKEEGRTLPMLDEVRGLYALLEEMPDYVALLATPSIPEEERLSLLDAALTGRCDTHLLSLCKLMTERGYAAAIPGALLAYVALYREEAGILEAEVVSAVPLTEKERERLIARLSARTGKTVEITERVDPDLIGGMRVTVGGKLYDGTVSGRLARLQEKLDELPIS